MLFIRGMVDTFSISELQKSRLMLYKTNNECFSFVRWYSYFHSVKDERFYSIFHLIKIAVPLHS